MSVKVDSLILANGVIVDYNVQPIDGQNYAQWDRRIE